MATQTWIANTIAKAAASIAGDELVRLVDDPGGTPSSKKATVAALAEYFAAAVLDIDANTLDVVDYVDCNRLHLSAVGSPGVRLADTADGVLRLLNNASDGFNRIQLGGTTNSFPAIKRSTTTVQIKLADDSAFTLLESLSLKTQAPTGGTSGTWKLGVAAAGTPTLPDTTIEVDIAGTIYYIHAKTTND